MKYNLLRILSTIKKNINLKNILVFILFFLALFYRVYNLDYSDYQGDEIKSLLITKESQSISDFLLDQRKGPIQFLTTFLVSGISNNYENKFIVRLPFALAGFFSVVLFYLISNRVFKNNTYLVLFITTIFSFNGFFLSFSRFTQYQSFVILFGLLAIYFLQLAVENENLKKLGPILASLSFGLALLAHYDALFFTPILIFLIWDYYKKYKNIKQIIICSSLFFFVVGSFYIPYIFSENFNNVKDYLNSRVEGSLGVQENMPTNLLFKVYNPAFISLIFSILGLAFLINLKYSLKFYKIGIWFLFSYILMEYVVVISGTHIYVYIIPMILLLGIGAQNIYELGGLFSNYKNIYQNIVKISGFVIAGFIVYQGYHTHIETSNEYPYEELYFIGRTVPKPNTNYLVPVFGFPHYRHWDEIRDFFSKYPEGIIFSTNEEAPITRYYMKNHVRDSKRAQFYIRIINSQSYIKDTNSKQILRSIETLKPVKEFYNGNKKVVEIYQLF